MSFEFTDREKLRVALASVLGVKLDAIGHTDLAIIALLAALHLLQLIPTAYVLLNRRHPRIRSHSPVLLTLMHASGMLYFVGDVATHEMMHPVGLLKNCIFVIVWLRAVLGLMATYSLLTTHATVVYFRNRSKDGAELGAWAVAAFALLGMSVNFAIGVTVSLLSTDRTVSFVTGIEVCQFHSGFKDAVVVLAWVCFLGLLLACAAANMLAERGDGEARELARACTVLAAAMVLHTVVFYRMPRYPANLAWRAAVVCCDQAAWFAAWWLVMGPALARCMRDKRAERRGLLGGGK
ncbi:hypothetical protein LPJ53_001765 [Coemansia erecta]|uniref:Uncharacterized protein n=1 Tax=Coemansia erecta TaxID=147472 RepID=A0A9W8CUI7_9FUNG|nr:hypothetical protein LPJ53_001765 [Coemansia erecta]